MNVDISHIIKHILQDIQVDLKDEFDQNFERQAFFNEAWQRRRSPIRPDRNILVDNCAGASPAVLQRKASCSAAHCPTPAYTITVVRSL